MNYYKILIKGKNVKQFYKKIIKNNIEVFDILLKKDNLVLKCNYNNYNLIKKINYINEINIVKVYGIKRLNYIYKKYKVSIYMFIFFLVFIIYISNHIFFININTTNKELKQNIKNELKKNNITIFSKTKTMNKYDVIESNIKNNLKSSIEWIEISRKGLILDINIIERIKEEQKEKNTINDIVAKENGYIMDIYSSSGEVRKNINDYVKKGEVIISGNITKNDEIVSQTSANGKVYAKVWYKLKINKSIYYQEKNNTKYGYKKIYINILNKKILIFKVKTKLKKEKEKVIIKTNLFSLIKQNTYIKQTIKKIYKTNELKNLLIENATNYIKKSLKEDEYITDEKTLKSYIENDKMYLEIFYEVYKDIAEEHEIIKEEN